MKRLISVHIPKTGGSTFRSLLKQHFGEDLLLDYADRPMTHSRWGRSARALWHAYVPARIPEQVRCIHGHFLPLKYSRLPDASFAVWLRHPVERVISRYYYYLNTFNENDPHYRKYVKKEQLSLVEFCRIPHYHNLYAKYLSGFALQRFDFVGITENYEQSLHVFQQLYEIDVPDALQPVNRNPDKKADRYEVDPEVRRLILQTNQKDMALYETALGLNKQLVEKPPAS